MKTTLLSTMLALATTGLLGQTTIFVKPDATGDGTSWSNATDIETAATRATSGAQVWVQAGTYYPKTMLTVADGVALYGGFEGTELSLLQRDLTDKTTVIDAQKKYGSVIRLGMSATLNGFTIQNGDAQHNPHRNGGGIWADDNTIIENCIIINNTTQINGGGLYSKGPTQIINTTIQNNTAKGSGDNMYGHCKTVISDVTLGVGSEVVVLNDTITLRDTVLVYNEIIVPDTVVVEVPSCTSPTITAQPATTAQTKGVNETFPTLYVTVTATPTATYQWYSNTANSNATGTPIADATNASYAHLAPDTSGSVMYFYCVIANSCGTITSNVSGTHTVSNYCNTTSSISLGTVEYIKSGVAYSATSTAHETTISGNGVTQIWSGFARASGCNKTSFNGGSSGNYNADCRSANSRANFGDYFSWCAVVRYKDELCPSPWRVPTRQDFIDLDRALVNGAGNNRDVTSGGTEITAYRAMGTNQWGGTNSTSSWVGHATDPSGAGAGFWSSEQSSSTDGHGLYLGVTGIDPQCTGATKQLGFSLRCVRD